MMWKHACALLILTLAQTSCANGPAPVVSDDGCSWTRYILPTAHDWTVMSPELAADIIAHNETREDRCK